MKVDNVLILGGGSAGIMAALTLKTKLPHLDVLLLRSKALGIIGVGEGTTLLVPHFLHGYLKIPPAEFIRDVKPVHKLGLKFIWGKRDSFNYTFNPQWSGKFAGLKRDNGFYVADGDCNHCEIASSLSSHDRLFERGLNGMPMIHSWHGWHLENHDFVTYLEKRAAAAGVRFDDDVVTDVIQSEAGVKELVCESGRRFPADLFVDASGFTSVLLGGAMQEPFVSFGKSLFCDRAVVGGWDRSAGDPIRPYTTCETMECGWCWQIDHVNRINRGYVYASAFISDEEAEREFRAKNPLITKTRVVKFVSGHRRRSWVKNVVGIGNSVGFVEPLEATALAIMSKECRALARSLDETDCVLHPGIEVAYNRWQQAAWDDIRSFLAMHYKFNDRIDNAFWRACRSDTDLGKAADFAELWDAYGPSSFWVRSLVGGEDAFGAEGYLALMVGMNVPHRNRYTPTVAERELFEKNRADIKRRARVGFTVAEALPLLGNPRSTYPDNFYTEDLT